ncbi:MAG: DNA-3-methyladenine glycosylase I [Pseudomonadales bacterium]
MSTVKDARCSWCGTDPLYVKYHDEEWGIPCTDDGDLFERMMLEGQQAGLSWFTILQKRERMRERFFEFDVQRLARASARNVESWLKDAGLIRHRGKLEALIGNARIARDLDVSLAQTLWQFVDHQPLDNAPTAMADVPTTTAAAQAMSKHLKKLGFKFVGPTICYALMQSAGLVNDHFATCPEYAACKQLGARVTMDKITAGAPL